MKSPPTSTITSGGFCLFVVFIVLLLSMTPRVKFCSAALLEPHSTHHHSRRHHGHGCNSFSSQRYPPSLCFQPKRLHRQPPPPSPLNDEIDPRYGVEKRLVPTGPNPLHN
uniref:CLAVATA3/ESR (CLE)-related protein 9-like n=1 Tax=Nelumbo nucifera TaxID=4432 RepID=A0A822YIU1_NELNU|nr:TPA_asm: hypothetical protein HUJ06_010262 [Nelumbo nucifera]